MWFLCPFPFVLRRPMIRLKNWQYENNNNNNSNIAFFFQHIIAIGEKESMSFNFHFFYLSSKSVNVYYHLVCTYYWKGEEIHTNPNLSVMRITIETLRVFFVCVWTNVKSASSPFGQSFSHAKSQQRSDICPNTRCTRSTKAWPEGCYMEQFSME